ncbi:B- and T-lymphocyte attenuator-like [Eleutherodactylus coqui]|uniref:B- and T-lymphocyte attenuator-like n=1 Tax=Eleutherodactylus coqui TaxID=57060 RepID=UPI0034630401
MGALVPASWRSHALLYMAATLSLGMSLTDEDNSSCAPEINMTGQHKFGKSPGQPLTLKCPVRLCHQGSPNVTWCKINEPSCDPVRIGEEIYSSMENQKTYAVYVLKFKSVQINDTGYYKCKANYGKHSLMGKTVQVVISDEFVAENLTAINITETANTTDITNTFHTFTLLVYIMATAGGVCVLIITVSLLIYCQKHFKEKNKSSTQDPAPTEELQFVAMPESTKNSPQYMQRGTPTLMDTDLTAVTVEVTYDNAQMVYKSPAQNVPHDREEDSIVYADLNHNAKKSSFHLVADCDVEYATVHRNEPRKNDCNK